MFRKEKKTRWKKKKKGQSKEEKTKKCFSFRGGAASGTSRKTLKRRSSISIWGEKRAQFQRFHKEWTRQISQNVLKGKGKGKKRSAAKKPARLTPRPKVSPFLW